MKRPIEGVCPVCVDTFVHPIRKQGGGPRKKYCSQRCRSLDWSRGHGGKRKTAVTRYDNKPETKEQKRQRSRKLRLRGYGWNETEFEQQLVRQNFACYGCLKDIDKQTARIDHCHITDKVRGLLCDSCNWGLGHLKDNPGTLRRLMAYLERDNDKTLIYLVGALKNPRVPEIAIELRKEGFDVMDEWFTPGKHADENWQAYEKLRGRTYQEALRGRAATNIFLFDKSYLDLSDIVIVVAPAGKSAMLELGYAAGRGKRTYLLLDGADPERYEVMPNFASKVFFSLDELIKELKG